ncbi:MAG TPA: type III-B CRISPR module-associated Cmr3 family protein [Desulfosporosinus sp.]|nr:type III-B CRISPR module-associated Cmr3 family protein [Desulfosporosinus sp.]
MAVLVLNALDTLFFRDAKPFSMGEDAWANGIFPPPLSVVYGALRAVYLSEHIGELEHANGDLDQTLRLKINFFAYHGGGKYYYPCPLDIVEKKERKNKNKAEYLMLKLDEKPDVCCSSLYAIDVPMVLQSQEQVKDALGLIDEISLNEYLERNSVPKGLLHVDTFLKDEPKVGIGRDDRTKTSDDGMLYRVGMKRMHQLSFAVGYEGVDISGNLMKLGGEGKSVSMSLLEHEPSVRNQKNYSKNFFKLYMATPAIFKEGWHPSPEKIPGAKLVAAVVGKPLSIGGFDMKPKNGRRPSPKPIRRAVPAGSVYYYSGSIEEVRGLHGTSISDYGTEQGYGIVYIGNVGKDS